MFENPFITLSCITDMSACALLFWCKVIISDTVTRWWQRPVPARPSHHNKEASPGRGCRVSHSPASAITAAHSAQIGLMKTQIPCGELARSLIPDLDPSFTQINLTHKNWTLGQWDAKNSMVKEISVLLNIILSKIWPKMSFHQIVL